MKTTALFSVLVAMVLALGACGGGDKPDTAAKADKPAASAKASEAAAAEPAAPVELPALPAFDVEPRGVINDVKVDSCDTKEGPVTATGTATNSGKFARDIIVVVNWSDPSSTAVVARGVAKVENVEPGASADWTAEADVEGAESVTCVTTALAGQLT